MQLSVHAVHCMMQAQYHDALDTLWLTGQLLQCLCCVTNGCLHEMQSW